MAQDYRVPIALIRRLCYPSGYHLPKLERLEFPPKKPSAVVTPINHYRVIDASKGNLPREMYEFFIGKLNVNEYVATCRWCGAHVYGEHSWAGHGKSEGVDKGCKRHLKDLYRTLTMTQQHECIVCDSSTSCTTWGVPLCSKKCEQAFMFEQPLTMRYELQQYRMVLEAEKNATLQS